MNRTTMLLAGGGLSIAAVAVGICVRARPHASMGANGATEDEDEDAGVADWCADGLSPIHGGGCLALPEGTTKGTPLVLYLHGIYDQKADADEKDRQRRVAKLATRRGFAVLALRGVEGGCSSDPEYATKWCWPSNERTAGRGPETVSGWQPALHAAARSGAGGAKYVLGFSNGGFFSGLLAVRAWFDADAFVVANAGPVEPVRALGAKPPLLLMSADDDASQDGMMRLDDELTRESWPHENYAHAGIHELTDDEIDAALTFFVRLRTEKPPFDPPLSSHRPKAREARRADEAGAADAVQTALVPAQTDPEASADAALSDVESPHEDAGQETEPAPLEPR